jgi:hypothetical protein
MHVLGWGLSRTKASVFACHAHLEPSSAVRMQWDTRPHALINVRCGTSYGGLRPTGRHALPAPVRSYEFFFGSERTATDDEVRAVEVQMSRLQARAPGRLPTPHTRCAVCRIAECCGVAG